MQITDSLLQRHLSNGCVAPSYLLIDRDVLKLKKIAKWFALEYLGVRGVTTDEFWLVPAEGSSSIQVEPTKEFVRKTSLAAVSGRRLFVICDAATMTIAAQNKILKTIEDVGGDICFLILASSAEPVLNTIKSRCVTIYPDPLKPEQVFGEFPNFPGEFNDGTLTTAEMFCGNKDAALIYGNARKLLFNAKSLDLALPLLPIMLKPENYALTLIALNHLSRELTTERRHVILGALGIINRNTMANCNAVNAFDTLLIKMFGGSERNG
jgi:hypothetical protein